MTAVIGAGRALSCAGAPALFEPMPPPPTGHWDASISLGFALRNGRTTLIDNRHAGPLVVQKPFYPQGDAYCETVILHPPGGIAGGDRLRIDINAGSGSEALLTTPGATRWYKSSGKPASQSVRIVADSASLIEWMPLETIVFDRADGLSRLEVDLRGNARAAGWEIVAFGRGASGERFSVGRFRQRIEVRRDGRLLWAEYGDIHGGDPLFDSPIGFAGNIVSGLLWLASDAGDDWTDECASAPFPSLLTGVTRLSDGIMLARCLGSSTEPVKVWLQQTWERWRLRYSRRALRAPRLWAT